MSEQFAFPSDIPRQTGFAVVDEVNHPEPVQLRYEVYGTGPTKIVLCMGFGTALEAWKFQAEHFASGANGSKYQVLAYDNRGAGRSSAPSIDNSVATMAEDCIHLIHHLGWNHVHLVGVSMGGMIAMEMAAMAPELLASLTLINTHSNGQHDNSTLRGRWLMLKPFFFGTRMTKAQVASNMVALLYGSALQKDSEWHQFLLRFHEYRASVAIRPTFKGFLSHAVSVRDHFVSPQRLAAIRAHQLPVLICAGDEDILILPHASKYIHQHLGGRLELFQGAGHGLNVEMRDKFNKLLEEHIHSATAHNTKHGRLKTPHVRPKRSKRKATWWWFPLLWRAVLLVYILRASFMMFRSWRADAGVSDSVRDALLWPLNALRSLFASFRSQ